MQGENQLKSSREPVPGFSVTFELPRGGTLTITVPGTLALRVVGCRAQPSLVFRPKLGKPRWGDLASLLAGGAEVGPARTRRATASVVIDPERGTPVVVGSQGDEATVMRALISDALSRADSFAMAATMLGLTPGKLRRKMKALGMKDP